MYAKVFKSMFDGSLRGQSDAILVFVNLLVSADRDGWVDRNFQAIADETGLSLSRVKAAIQLLESPDSQSRSKDLEGRRLERIDAHREWGWRIVNYVHYRTLAREYERREYLREKQSERRNSLRQLASTHVNTGQHCQPIAEAEAEVDAQVLLTIAQAPAMRTSSDLAFDLFWKAYPRKVGKADAAKAFAQRKCHQFIQTILSAIEAQKKSPQWMKDGGQYIPYPATWIRRGSWDDEVETEVASKPTALSNIDKVLKKQELDAVVNKMRTIRNSYDDHQTWTAKDKIEFQRLKAKKKELQQLLGIVV